MDSLLKTRDLGTVIIMEDNTNVGQEEIRVLLVDDDSTFRWVLARRLKRMGVDFVEAEDGEQAIKALEEGEFTLLITDIYMPGKDGFEVIKEVRQAESKEIEKTSIFVMSNLVNQEDIKEAKNLGVIEYIIKDKSNPIEIAKKVNAYLSK